jgi:hypothetical protein
MYVDAYAYNALLAFDILAVGTYAALAFMVVRGKRVGGLTFCKLGRFGFCFYFSRAATAAHRVPSRRTVTTVVEQR